MRAQSVDEAIPNGTRGMFASENQEEVVDWKHDHEERVHDVTDCG